MARIVRICLQSFLKLLNSIIGLTGMAMILYALWMIRVWLKNMDGSPFGDSNSHVPWFIYAFLGLGITLCMITCSGHIAAETANGHCLSCKFQEIRIHPRFHQTLFEYHTEYIRNTVDLKSSQYMVFVFLLLLLEAAVTADVFLNSDWEEDFPEDPTGRFDEFKDFVKSNFETCKWIGLLIISAQGLSILLAMVLRALGTGREIYYDSDDDYAPARLLLLKHPVQPPPYVVGDPQYAPKNDAWNIRIHEKVMRIASNNHIFGWKGILEAQHLVNIDLLMEALSTKCASKIEDGGAYDGVIKLKMEL
ncbi:hypothetical protein HHK36_001895 [Tetracentron sinense]|uniref:Tetraspanin-19 n=1 Tax=Tetracentron sinense TaxID=13715 RepID=A0A835DV44_TETSI|nr:hypothetical protein HHK36_001895 [Tetracentron sinense]